MYRLFTTGKCARHSCIIGAAAFHLARQFSVGPASFNIKLSVPLRVTPSGSGVQLDHKPQRGSLEAVFHSLHPTIPSLTYIPLAWVRRDLLSLYRLYLVHISPDPDPIAWTPDPDPITIIRLGKIQSRIALYL